MQSSRIYYAIALLSALVATNVLAIGVFRTSVARALAESVGSTINVSNGNSRGVALSPDGLFAYVTSEVDNALIRVDLSLNQVVQAIDVGNEPYGVTITPDGSFALVANFSSQSISKIRLSDNQVTTISLAGSPQSIVVDSTGSFAYVTLFYQNKVAKVNLVTNSVSANLTIGAGPRGIAMTPDGLFAFTANDGSNTSSKIDLTTFTVKKTIVVGTNPYGATVDASGQYAYISNLNGGGISKIDVSSESVVGSIGVSSPWAMVIVPGTPFAYASESNSRSVAKINLNNNSVLSSVSVGLNPRGLAVNAAASSVFVTNYGTGRLQRIDVLPENQLITFGSLPDVSLSRGTLTVSASASSGLVVSFSSTTSAVCTVSGTIVTLVDYGVCTVQANQAGGPGWPAALKVSQSFTVARQVITFGSLPDVLLSSGTLTVSASASSGLVVSFSSTTSDVCTVSGTIVTLIGSGECTIEASQNGANGDSATPVTQSFYIAPIPPLGEVGVSINDGRSYSNLKTVSIFMVWPAGATKARISNDGGFTASKTKTVSLSALVDWELDDSLAGIYTKIVYVRFSGSGIDDTKTYSDDIILDSIPPSVSTASGTSAVVPSSSVTAQSLASAQKKNGAVLRVKASDRLSGIGSFEVKTSSKGKVVSVRAGSPKARSHTIKVKTKARKIWLRSVDRAGNKSRWVIAIVK